MTNQIYSIKLDIPFFLALSTLLFSIGSSPMIIPVISSISFVWCEIWGLLGLIRKKKQKSN